MLLLQVRPQAVAPMHAGEGAHSPEEWEAIAREAAPEFTGEIVCGVDLDEFALSG
jgi:hypothetical protein